MNSLRNISLKNSYDTGFDDLVSDFYIPALECAHRYDRITGFFSSSSLALAARGIAELVNNGGRMRMITCPRLEAVDADMISRALKTPEEILASLSIDEDGVEDSFRNDHVAALGWMLAKGILEIRIALIYDNDHYLSGDETAGHSIMHQKVGIIYDDSLDSISFSGSNNETVSGWSYNCEEFKVFRSWEPGQSEYFNGDRDRFEKMWSGEHPKVRIYPLPEAVKNNLIERSTGFDIGRIAPGEYRKHVQTKGKQPFAAPVKPELTLFPYQAEAVEKWLNHGRSLIFEMATGTGKTRTAIGCMDNVFRETKKPVLAVIACPGNPLMMQWRKDIKSLNIRVDRDVVCDSSNSGWNRQLEKEIAALRAGMYHSLVVYTTHQTCSSEKFISLIENTGDRIATLFIADEAHGMGATKAKRGLLDHYGYRLGLSATPARWFDDDGTAAVIGFFGDDSFRFTTRDALNTINPLTNRPFLVNYSYYPSFISLTPDELEEYRRITEKLRKMFPDGKAEEKEDLQAVRELLLFRRADIGKSAENKYTELEKILDNRLHAENGSIKDTIIFVSPEQLPRVLLILRERGITAHSFTEEESTQPSPKYGGISERDYILSMFRKHEYDVLVAIKCLDEGIDVPGARRAIIMASSTNPREYIQRIGRVIRQAENKPNAEIYDMVLAPDNCSVFGGQLKELEKQIFMKELNRVTDISADAINNVDVMKTISQMKGVLRI